MRTRRDAGRRGPCESRIVSVPPRAPGPDQPRAGGGPKPGSRPTRGLTHAEDVGLFGPTSVTWRLHAEPVMGIAGLRALLLQALHPVAAAGVARRRAAADGGLARPGPRRRAVRP